MNDLDKAREWVDAEKLREAINEHLSSYPHGSVGYAVAEDLACKLQDLFPDPPLPTLADMTPEDREACKRMQAQTWHEVGVIVWVDELTEIAQLITRANGVLKRKFRDITPLPDLPKLEWPAQELQAQESHTWEGDGSNPADYIQKVADMWDDIEKSPAPPRPSDLDPENVPPGEPRIVEYDDHKWVGTRESIDRESWPWVLARLDGANCCVARDSKIALVSRLVPEATA